MRSRRRTGSLSVELQDRERACSTPITSNSFGLLPKSIVNEKLIHLETTTSTVLSFILTNLWGSPFAEMIYFEAVL